MFSTTEVFQRRYTDQSSPRNVRFEVLTCVAGDSSVTGCFAVLTGTWLPNDIGAPKEDCRAQIFWTP
jgi:hypothetical protein